MEPHAEEAGYKPKDALGDAVQAGLIVGGIALTFCAVANSKAKTNVGALGLFKYHGGTIATQTLVGGAYGFSRAMSANLREKDDHWNEAIGGFCAGAVMGMPTKKMPAILGRGAFVSAVVATFAYTGNSLSGWANGDPEEEFDRKEKMRKNRRRPIEETIEDVGEGRGIKPIGYEERRRQRLKEKYGLDINPVSADPDAP